MTREEARLAHFRDEGTVLLHEWEGGYDYRYRALAIDAGTRTHIVYEVNAPHTNEWRPVDTLKTEPNYSAFARIVAAQLASELIYRIHALAVSHANEMTNREEEGE